MEYLHSTEIFFYFFLLFLSKSTKVVLLETSWSVLRSPFGMVIALFQFSNAYLFLFFILTYLYYAVFLPFQKVVKDVLQ